MSLRNLITALALLVCAGAVCAVLIQRQKLAALRAEEQTRASVSQRPDGAAGRTTEAETPPANAEPTVSAELLQLRSDVTRLKARQRELAGMPAENQRLRAQLAAVSTNAPGASLPLGFIRKSQAQMVGYATPENTLQSFLWALQNRDLTNLFRALTPASAQRLQEQLDRPGMTSEAFFEGSQAIPGLGIRNRQTLPDGSVELDVGVTAGDTGQKIKFQPLAGEWRLDGLF